MTYNTAIPIATDDISVSQTQMLANMQIIAQSFGKNHVPLTGSPSRYGVHTIMNIIRQTGDPTTGADQTALYTKDDGSGATQLFFRPESDATPIQLTNSNVQIDEGEDHQFTFMAGPFTVYGGIITNPSSGTLVVLTPTTDLVYAGVNTTNFKFTTNSDTFYNIASTAYNVNTVQGTFRVGFSATTNASTRDIYYLAIGV